MARATLPALLSEPALVLPAVQGAPERLAGEGAGVLAVLQQHLAIDQHIIYPHGTLPHVHLPARELIDGLTWLGANGVRVEDGDVGGLPGGEEAPVMESAKYRGEPLSGTLRCATLSA